MPTISSIAIPAGDEGVRVVGVILSGAPSPFRDLTCPCSGDRGMAAAVAAPGVLRVQVYPHPRGGVPFEEPSKGVHTGPSGGLVALDILPGLLQSPDGGLSGMPLASLWMRAVPSSRTLCDWAFSASKPLISASDVASSLGTFCRAVSVASGFVASGQTLFSAPFRALSWARASSNAPTSAFFLAMASWAAPASRAAAASRASASISHLSLAVTASRGAAALTAAEMAATAEASAAMPFSTCKAPSCLMRTALSTPAFCCAARSQETQWLRGTPRRRSQARATSACWGAALL